MLVRAYDPLSADKPKFSQNLRGIIDEVASFRYTRRAYDIGSFEMTIPSSEEAKQIIVPGVIIIAGDALKHSYIVDTTQRTISNNAFYVTSVTDTDNETIHITGYDLKYLLSFRITLFPQEEQDKGTYGYYVVKGNTFHCVSDLINYNLTNSSDEKRKIFGFGRLVMPTVQIEAGLTGIADDRYMTRLEPLSTAVFNLLKNCKTHFWEVQVMIDEQADLPDGYIPRMESGEDKPPLIITPDLYNISAYDKSEDISSYKNVLYAVSNDGVSTKALVQAISKNTTSDSGITRKEVVVDVDAETIEDISAYALKAGEEYEAADDFEVTPIFGEEEALSLAQSVVVKLGTHTYTSIVTEITDEYSDNGHTCSFIVGNKKIKVLNVLNKAIASTNQKTISNKLVLSGAANIDTAIVLQEHELQSVCHNFTEIGYISGNSIGYGDTPNTIICNGILIRNDNDKDYQNCPKYKYFTFSKGSDFYAAGAASISAVSNIVIDVAVESVYDTYKNLRSQITVTNTEDGTRRGYTLTRFSVNTGEDYAVSPSWSVINPPTETYPYGSVRIYFDTLVCDTDGVWERQYTNTGVYLNVAFASEAEYNAAIGLTNTPLELIKLQDFQYLVPESQLIVDKELSENSDNTIANSTVAKALSSKAEKEAVEKLSLVVESKADIIEVEALAEIVNDKADSTAVAALSEAVDNKADKSEVQLISQAVEGKAEQSEVTALSEDYNTAKTDFDTRIKKLASASANHGIILNEHADALANKAEASDLTAHTDNTDNPHNVTKAQIGLGSVENKSSAEILSELEIGGRNLLLAPTNDTDFGSSGDLRSVRFRGWHITTELINPDWNSHYGEKLTYKCWLDNTSGFDKTGIMLLVLYADGTYYEIGGGYNGALQSYMPIGEAGWCRITITIPDPTTRPNPTTITSISARIRHNAKTTEYYTHPYRYAKVELGDKATDWTPAPEDAEKRITSLEDRVDELEISDRNYIVDSGKGFVLEGKGLETSVTKNMHYPDMETAESLDGKTVTISFDYENNITEGQCDFRRNLSWGLILRFTPEQNVGKGSYKLTFTIGDYEHTNTAAVYLQGAFSGSVTIRNLKLELGNKATDWSVAPEDVVRLEERVAALEAAILSLGGET